MQTNWPALSNCVIPITETMVVKIFKGPQKAEKLNHILKDDNQMVPDSNTFF